MLCRFSALPLMPGDSKRLDELQRHDQLMDRSGVLYCDVERELTTVLYLLQLLLLFGCTVLWVFLRDSLDGDINRVTVDLSLRHTGIKHGTHYRSEDTQPRSIDT